MLDTNPSYESFCIECHTEINSKASKYFGFFSVLFEETSFFFPNIYTIVQKLFGLALDSEGLTSP